MDTDKLGETANVDKAGEGKGSTGATDAVRSEEREQRKRTKTDQYKEHLTDDDLDAARREANGEIV